MAKSKTPLFSLGATGSLGNTLTMQKHGHDTLLRTKPIPAYQRTLPQQYQRWLYEDYAYLWTQQTEVIKRQFAADGSRYHLTGFQYWMKYTLTELPDMAAWWRLDEKTSAVALDSSRNTNNGTITGATRVPGTIDNAIYFDGINDSLIIPSSPSLKLSSAFTIDFFLTLYPGALSLGVNLFKPHPTDGFDYMLYTDSIGEPCIYFKNPAGVLYTTGDTIDRRDSKPHSIIATFDGTYLALFVDGSLRNILNTGGQTVRTSDTQLQIAGGWGTFNRHTADNLILYTRALDSTQVFRHSLRRYPA